MPHYKYLIVGGGMTGDAAVGGIRQADAEGTIGLIGAEPDPPYSRPPLSKGLWKGRPWKYIWLKNSVKEASLHLGRMAVGIDAENNRIFDDQGLEYGYEKLLLATGGASRHLSFDAPGIIYFRTVGDYQQLRLLAEEKRRFAVIGGGFIGAEIAAALAMNNREVMLIFSGSGIGNRLFPADLSGFLNEYYREKGVEVLAGEKILNVAIDRNRYFLRTSKIQTKRQQTIEVDAVVAGIGIQPNVDLARQAGMETADGIRVDSALKTNCPNVYAAGDAAEFFNPALGKYLRAEHEDNANTMGEMAGRSMAGQEVSYAHLPFFYSDLFDLGYEAVGEIDSRLVTVADWKEPFHEGVIYYLHEDRVRGVLLWNVWGQIDAARDLISEKGPFQAEDLKGRVMGK